MRKGVGKVQKGLNLPPIAPNGRIGDFLFAEPTGHMFFRRSSAPAAPAVTDAVAPGGIATPPPPVVAAPPPGVAPRPPVVPPPAPNGPRGVILVVDDSTMIRHAVAHTLETQGHEVLQADDGVNGLAVWEKDKARITLIISDVFMPRMDGLTMARELRRRNKALPIILMSSKLDEDSRWIAEEAGFRLLPKPFKDAYLVELAARMLKLRTAS